MNFPKAIPLNIMQLQRQSGNLQLVNPSQVEGSEDFSSPSFQTSIQELQEVLKQFGKSTLNLTDRVGESSVYFVLNLHHEEVILKKVQPSQTIEMRYSFQTGTLLFDGTVTTDEQDISQLSIFIIKVAKGISEGTIKLTGGNV